MSTATEDRTTRLRTPPAKGLADGASAIDRKAGIIHGFSVIQKGPALGHGTEIDDTTLEQVRDLGNASKAGSKMRFTHPNMSNDGLGKYLGRAKNFRIVGDRVLADAHIADTAYETPSGDLASYVFDLAEEDPKAFAASISFHGQTQQQTNPDGTIARNKPPLVRVTRLQAVDLVDSPAANRDGLLTELSEETLPDWPARQVSHALDQVFADKSADEIRAQAGQFIARYLANKGLEMSTAVETKASEAPAAKIPTATWSETEKCWKLAEGVEVNAAQVEALNAVKVNRDATAEREAAHTTAETTTALSETDIERKRCREIMAHCDAARLPQLAKGYIDSGLSVKDCMTKLFHEVTNLNAPLTDEGSAAGKLGEKPNPDAKYEAEYLAEKGACDEFGISKEVFIFSCKTRDGIDCEWPADKK